MCTQTLLGLPKCPLPQAQPTTGWLTTSRSRALHGLAGPAAFKGRMTCRPAWVVSRHTHEGRRSDFSGSPWAVLDRGLPRALRGPGSVCAGPTAWHT